MPSSRGSSKTKELFRSFLKERELTTIYRRYRSLKRRRRKAVNINVGGEDRPVVAFRIKNRIVFRDPKSLNVVSTTSRFKTLRKLPLFINIFERDRKTYLDLKLKKGVFKPQFRRTDVKREIFKKTIQYRTMKPLSQRVGKIFLRIKFYKLGKSYTVEGGSRRLRLLTSSEERQKSFDEAFQGALFELPIYDWNRYEILTIRFFYTMPKTDQRLVFA